MIPMQSRNTAEPAGAAREVSPIAASVEDVLALLERQNEVLAKIAKVVHGKALMAEVSAIGARIKALL
jgi:hypothetical protein